jgi:hypothetical protein
MRHQINVYRPNFERIAVPTGTRPWTAEAQSPDLRIRLRWANNISTAFVLDMRRRGPRSWRLPALFANGFLNRSRDLACRNVWAALGLERAGVAVVLAQGVDHRAFFRHPIVWLGESGMVFSQGDLARPPIGSVGDRTTLRRDALVALQSCASNFLPD